MANKYSWSCRTQAEIVSQNNTTATIRVHCYWKADDYSHHMSPIYGWVTCDGKEELVYNGGWIDTRNDRNALVELGQHDFVVSKGYSDRYVRCSARNKSGSSFASGERFSDGWDIGIDAKKSYTVSYNANGGSGAPSNQTKWYNETLTLSENRPSRDGHNFLGWATSSGGNVAYQPGNNYNSNSGATLYAKWEAHTYTVSYNANGGSGAPGSQTKIYGQNLTLSSVKPTRTNYNFLGWSTSLNGGVNYKSGAAYTSNSKITLYAVWQLAYKAPRISGFNVYRCTSNGTASESGTYLKYVFDWSTDRNVSSIRIYYKLQTAADWISKSISVSGTSGKINEIFGDGKVSSESSYIAKAHVQDSGGTTYSSELSIGTAKFPIDIRAGGTGVAIGKASEADNFDVDMESKFRKKSYFINGVDIKGELYKDGKTFLNLTYPVGSLYMSTNNTSPASLFGGTWARLNGGFIYGANNSWGTGNGTGTYTNNHTLSISEMPSHNHAGLRWGSETGPITLNGGSYSGYNLSYGGGNNGSDGIATTYKGGGGGHSHNIPYIAVFTWRRTG